MPCLLILGIGAIHNWLASTNMVPVRHLSDTGEIWEARCWAVAPGEDEERLVVCEYSLDLSMLRVVTILDNECFERALTRFIFFFSR